MSFELNVLKIVCQRLESIRTPYMLTGSFAANFYIVPRMTRDIDIVIEIEKPEVEEIFQVFKSDFYIDKGSIQQAVENKGMFNIIHNESIFKVDFIIRKNAVYRSIEFQRRKQVQLDNIPIWIVSPEDLIISKIFWAKDSLSEIQLNDVKKLLTSLNNLDFEYIGKWVRTLKLDSVYEKVKTHV